MTAAPERCIKPPVPTVGRNAKFRSNPQKAALSTAKSAMRSIDHQEDGSQIIRMCENTHDRDLG